MSSDLPIKKGAIAENKAYDFLIKQGLKDVCRNYRCNMGEIDLIMREGNAFVFVEVRQRTSNLFGGASASITFKKQQKIIKTALHYLKVNRIKDKFPIRFDVISLDGKQSDINWIKNAFGAA